MIRSQADEDGSQERSHHKEKQYPCILKIPTGKPYKFQGNINSYQVETVKPIGINTQLTDNFKITQLKERILSIVLLKNYQSEECSNDNPFKYHRHSARENLSSEKRKTKGSHIYKGNYPFMHMGNKMLEFAFI